MTRRIGTMAAGIVIGLVVTGILLYQEEKNASGENTDNSGDKRNGLYAEISGNTVAIRYVPTRCGMEDFAVTQKPGPLRATTKHWSGQ